MTTKIWHYKMQKIWYYKNKIQNLAKRWKCANNRAITRVSRKIKLEITLARLRLKLSSRLKTKKKKKKKNLRFTTRGIFRQAVCWKCADFIVATLWKRVFEINTAQVAVAGYTCKRQRDALEKTVIHCTIFKELSEFIIRRNTLGRASNFIARPWKVWQGVTGPQHVSTRYCAPGRLPPLHSSLDAILYLALILFSFI